MRDAYWIPREERRDQEQPRTVLYAPSPYEIWEQPPEHESEAEAETDEQARVVIIEI